MKDPQSKSVIRLISFVFLLGAEYVSAAPPPTPQERMVEWTIESKKAYPDPQRGDAAG
jgi:hypothetical protein